jgi:hypothetical protein
VCMAPGVARDAESGSLREGPLTKLWRVGLAYDHRSRCPQSLHRGAVAALGIEAACTAESRLLPGEVDVVLDRDWHAKQRQTLPLSQAPVCSGGLRNRLLREHAPEGAKRALPLDPAQRQRDQLGRGDLTSREHARLGGDSREGELLLSAGCDRGCLLHLLLVRTCDATPMPLLAWTLGGKMPQTRSLHNLKAASRGLPGCRVM